MSKHYVMYNPQSSRYWVEYTYQILREEDGKYICLSDSQYDFGIRQVQINKEHYEAIELSEEFYILKEDIDPSKDDNLINKEPYKKIKVLKNHSISDRSLENEIGDVIAENDKYIQIRTKDTFLGIRESIFLKDGFDFEVLEVYEKEYDYHLDSYEDLSSEIEIEGL